jgi:hypothetical protein
MKLLRMFLAPIVAVELASTAAARAYHDLVVRAKDRSSKAENR